LQHDEARKLLTEILDQKIGFDGHFDRCFGNLKETQQNELIVWVKSCRDRQENPIQSKKDRNIIGFVRKFGSNLRAILTKEKEGYFLRLFLDKHKYYEAEMQELGF
jgi:hypothetical protein